MAQPAYFKLKTTYDIGKCKGQLIGPFNGGLYKGKIIFISGDAKEEITIPLFTTEAKESSTTLREVMRVAATEGTLDLTKMFKDSVIPFRKYLETILGNLERELKGDKSGMPVISYTVSIKDGTADISLFGKGVAGRARASISGLPDHEKVKALIADWFSEKYPGGKRKHGGVGQFSRENFEFTEVPKSASIIRERSGHHFKVNFSVRGEVYGLSLYATTAEEAKSRLEEVKTLMNRSLEENKLEPKKLTLKELREYTAKWRPKTITKGRHTGVRVNRDALFIYGHSQEEGTFAPICKCGINLTTSPGEHFLTLLIGAPNIHFADGAWMSAYMKFPTSKVDPYTMEKIRWDFREYVYQKITAYSMGGGLEAADIIGSGKTARLTAAAQDKVLKYVLEGRTSAGFVAKALSRKDGQDLFTVDFPGFQACGGKFGALRSESWWKIMPAEIIHFPQPLHPDIEVKDIKLNDIGEKVIIARGVECTIDPRSNEAHRSLAMGARLSGRSAYVNLVHEINIAFPPSRTIEFGDMSEIHKIKDQVERGKT